MSGSTPRGPSSGQVLSCIPEGVLTSSALRPQSGLKHAGTEDGVADRTFSSLELVHMLSLKHPKPNVEVSGDPLLLLLHDTMCSGDGPVQANPGVQLKYIQPREILRSEDDPVLSELTGTVVIRAS